MAATRLTTIALLLGLGAGLGACGDDDASNTSGGGGGGERVAAADREPLPLQVWEDAILGTGEERIAQERETEQAVADCMTAQGFEYTPVEPHPGALADQSEGSPWSLPEADFAERYGYGLFTIDAPGVTDPNAARLAAMDESEHIAYFTALEGPAEEDVQDGAEATTVGCYDQALMEVLGGQLSSEEFAGFVEEYDALFEREESDPRIEDAAQEWSDCMVAEDSRYGADHPDGAPDIVLDRLDDLAPEGLEVGTINIESVEIEGQSRQVHRLDGLDVSTLDDQFLRTMRAYEIDVATADYGCRANFDNVSYEVMTEYEEEFVEEHRTELEQLRDGVAASTGDGAG